MPKKKSYDEWVRPHLKLVEKWSTFGETEERIRDRLGVGKNVWIRFKGEHKELREALKKGRQDLVSDIKAALAERAKGGFKTETKEVVYADGSTRTETTTKYIPADTGACCAILKNYDDNWSDNPKEIRLKREKLDLERQVVDAKTMPAWEPMSDVLKP
jgi:hypothetical protein